MISGDPDCPWCEERGKDPRAMSGKEREATIELIRALADSLEFSAPHYISTLGGLAQHVAALQADLKARGQ